MLLIAVESFAFFHVSFESFFQLTCCVICTLYFCLFALFGVEADNLPTLKYSKFNMKLMELGAEELGIPDEFPCSVSMPAQEFQHICSRIVHTW